MNMIFVFLPTHFFLNLTSGSLYYYYYINVNYEKRRHDFIVLHCATILCIILYAERTTNAYAILLYLLTYYHRITIFNNCESHS